MRGFDGEQTLSAENGIIIRNELSVAIPELRLEPYLGLDLGHVWGPSDEYLLGKNLAGAVFGIRAICLKACSMTPLSVRRSINLKALKHRKQL